MLEAGQLKVPKLPAFSHLPPSWGAWLTHLAQAHPCVDRARTWHARKVVCLQKLLRGYRPILISSVWVKLLSRLLLKEAGAPLKELVKEA